MAELSPFDIQNVITLIRSENAEVANQLQQRMTQDPTSLSADVVSDLAQQYLGGAEEGQDALQDTTSVGLMLRQLSETLRTVETAAPKESDIPNIASKSFNLLRVSQAQPPTGLPSFYTDPASLYKALELSDYETAIATLQETVTDQQFAEHRGNLYESLELIKEGLKLFYESDSPESRSEAAQMIYAALPGSDKATSDEDPSSGSGDTLMATPKNTESKTYADIVESSNKEIQKLAELSAKKIARTAAKPFNLLKTAQHGTDNNVIMWGPGQMRPDPFLRGQPVSDWHIFERNKGFGGDIDGYWGVDWEAVWRGNVMDKYSRPYRDAETGEWVGGYIEKRFEVDKWVPEGNNYQLKPGQRRKPRLPQYGVTEARLQHARSKEAERYNDSSEPFNWLTASSKQTKKAQAVNSDFSVSDVDPMANDIGEVDQLRKVDADAIAAGVDDDEYMSAYESGRWSQVYHMLDSARGQTLGNQRLAMGEEPMDPITGDDMYDRMLADQVYLHLSRQKQPEQIQSPEPQDMYVTMEKSEAANQPRVASSRKKKVTS